MIFAVHLNNYLESGGKPGGGGGGIGEITTKERRFRCKMLYVRRGALLFTFPVINWKKGRRAFRV